jgi:hypothetical protein
VGFRPIQTCTCESRPCAIFSAHCVDKTENENGVALGKLETHVKKIIDSEKDYEEPKVWIPGVTK